MVSTIAIIKGIKCSGGGPPLYMATCYASTLSLYLDVLRHWTVASKHTYLISIDSDRRYLDRDANGNIDFKKDYILEILPFLFVCHESQNILYDALLTFRYGTDKQKGIRPSDVKSSTHFHVSLEAFNRPPHHE